MHAISTENLWLAFSLTFAAGLATAVGSLLVLFSKRPNPRLLAFGLAFAGGAMVYVSLSEILNKSIGSFAQAYGDRLGYTYGTLWFLGGVLLVVLIDHLVPNPHDSLDKQDPAFHDHSHKQIRRVGLLSARVHPALVCNVRVHHAAFTQELMSDEMARGTANWVDGSYETPA